MIFAATAKSLNPGTVSAMTSNAAVAGARFEFSPGRASHVVAREHRVDDADSHFGFRLVFLLRHVAPIRATSVGATMSPSKGEMFVA